MAQPFSSVSAPLHRDLRYGLRKLKNNAGFTIVAVTCLALGICASVTVFSVVDALLLRPFPGVREQGRIVSLACKTVSLPGVPGEISPGLSYGSFLRYREAAHVFTDLVAYYPVSVSLTVGGELPLRVKGQLVSDDYFSALGMRPAQGRLLVAGEGERGAATGVVISQSLWQRFPSLHTRGVGSSIRLNGNIFVVLGVAPEGFHGTLHGSPSDVWIPVEAAPQIVQWLRPSALQASKPAWLLWFFGRLAPGVDLARAQSEMDLLTARLNQGAAVDEKVSMLMVFPGLGPWPGGRELLARPLVLASIVVGLLMLVVCANLGGLLLVKAAARQEEIGVQMVLGVTRGRLLRQLFTESLILAFLGGVAGFVLAFFTIDSIQGLSLGQYLPRIATLHVDGRVVAFTLGLTLGTGVLFGLVPALWSTRSELPLLRLGSGTGLLDRNRTRLQEIFVVGQIAISLVLLISTGLFVRTLLNLRSIDPGFDSSRVVDLRIDLSQGYSQSKGFAFYDQLLNRVRKLPAVDSAALTLTVPLSRNEGTGRFHEVRPEAGTGGKKALTTEYSVVSPDFFRTLEIPLLRGRDFSAEDRRGAPGVTIVNEELADTFWPGKNPLGERIVLTPENQAWEVVGVVRNIRMLNRETSQPYFYLPLTQRYEPELALQVKSASGDPMALENPIRGLVRRLDANLPVEGSRLDEEVQATLAQPRLFSWLLGSFSMVALLVTGIGLYGTLAYAVRRRTRELGIRMALGARSSEIMALVIRRGLALTLTGLVLGLVAAAWTTSVFASFLYEVTPTDPAVFILVAVLLTGVGLAASSLPAYYATRVDPMNVIRHE
jgi:putative ABC transport system permease protein